MASTVGKIKRASCLLTTTLLQAGHSNTKYCKQIRPKLQKLREDKSPGSRSGYSIYSAASQSRILNFITPQQQQQHHRFFHDHNKNENRNTEIVINNAEALSSIQDMEEVAERPLSELTTEELLDIAHYLSLKTDRRLSLNQSFANVMIINKAYNKFCRIQNVREISRVLHRLRELGFKGIVTYEVGDAERNADTESNLKQLLMVVSSMSLLPPGSVSFVSVRMTSICTKKLLDRVSDLLTWQYSHPEFNLPWKKETLPLFVPSSSLHHYNTSAPKPLTANEKKDLNLAEQRLFELCAAGQTVSLPLLVEAQPSTWLQAAIDYLVYRAFSEFNRSPGTPVVYWGVQAYRRDSLPRLIQVCQEAKKQGISMGVCLSRSYHSEDESEESYCERDRCYDACVSSMLNKVAAGEASVLLATHNLKSVKMVAAKAEELGIAKRDSGLQFVQLTGLAERPSLGLCKAGFDVSKYLPFGLSEYADITCGLFKRRIEHIGDVASFQKIMGNHSDKGLICKEIIKRLQKAGLKPVVRHSMSYEVKFIED